MAGAIALRLAPGDGEAIDSWLERYAALLHVHIADIFAAAGLRTTNMNDPASAKNGTAWPIALTTAQAAALSQVTGIPEATIKALTLSRFNGTGLTGADADAHLLVAARWWRSTHESRFCPACLGEHGRWQLSWRLPWSFACTTHHLLLADACPACGKRHRHRRPTLGGEAELCELSGLSMTWRRPGHGPIRCLHPPWDTPTQALPAHGAIITAQRHIDAVTTELLRAVDTGSDFAQVTRKLDDLHTVARAGLSGLQNKRAGAPPLVRTVLVELGVTITAGSGSLHAEPSTARAMIWLAGGRTPADATVIAAGTAISVAMLANREHDPDPEIAGWLADSAAARRYRGSPGEIAKTWADASPPIRAALLRRRVTFLDPVLQLRWHGYCGHPAPPVAGVAAARAALVPATIWSTWGLALTPADGFAPHVYRRHLAVLLLLAGDKDTTIEQAQRLLGHGRATAATLSSYLAGLARFGCLEATLTAIDSLAQALDEYGGPIDYQRRRQRRLISDAHLDPESWRRLQARLRKPDTPAWRTWANKLNNDMLPTWRSIEAMARARLIELLTGTHPAVLEGKARLSQPDRNRYNDFLWSLPAPAADHLAERARDRLRRGGIDEPVSWEPPLVWAGTVSRPGIDPDSVSITDVDPLRERGLRPRQIAGILGTTPEHIIAIAADHPRQSGKRLRSSRHTPTNHLPTPSSEELKALVDQGMQPRNIARVTGWPLPAIETLLITAGLRQPAPPPGPAIDPEWLREQYQVRGYGLKDIAAASGHSITALKRCAHANGIPLRQGLRGGTHVLADLGGPEVFPPAVWNTIATPTDVRRVQNILAIIGQPNLARAATALHMHGAKTLESQIQYLETTAGFKIINRASGRNGLHPTAAGAEYIRHARIALELLNKCARLS